MPSHSDCYFEIGHSHKVCEDYALAGSYKDMTYAILSDGCSASKDSDIGARLLSIIAKDVLTFFYDSRFFYEKEFVVSKFPGMFESFVWKKCLEIRAPLNLSVDIFDATLLVAVALPGAVNFVAAYGDGYIILKKTGSDTTIMHQIKYESGAPYYLSYGLQYSKNKAYEIIYGDTNVIIEQHKKNGGEKFRSYEEKDILPAAGNRYYLNSFDNDDLATADHIVLCSDGIATYEHRPYVSSPGDLKLSVFDVAPDIVLYKNMTGEFVNRRMNRLKRDNEKKGIIHQDDISVAAINVDYKDSDI